MALVARSVSVSTTPAVSASRPASTARGGSMAGAVNSVDSTTSVNLSEEAFSPIVGNSEYDKSDQETTSDRRNSQNERRDPDREASAYLPSTGIVDTSSETFAKIFQERESQQLASSSSGESGSSASTLRFIDRAVSLYESSENILTYSQNVRGETISLSL